MKSPDGLLDHPPRQFAKRLLERQFLDLTRIAEPISVTSAPAAVSARAMLRPMLLVEPVTMAARPLKGRKAAGFLAVSMPSSAWRVSLSTAASTAARIDICSTWRRCRWDMKTVPVG